MIIVLPMAGQARRFQEAGYVLPKPLIEINNRPMFSYAIDNLIGLSGKFLPVVLRQHEEKFHIDKVIRLNVPNDRLLDVYSTDKKQYGAAWTVHEALLEYSGKFDLDEELIVANCDQYFNWSFGMFINQVNKVGGHHILTFRSTSPKWSFVELSHEGKVVQIAEKNPISDHATVGVYYFRAVKDFFWAYNEMIKENRRFNNEFYTSIIYEYLLERGDNIYPFPVQEMFGFGTPEDLNDNKKYFAKWA